MTLNSYRYDGKRPVSIELLMASEVNLEELLSDLAARAISNQVAAQLALGDSNTEPAGAFTAGLVATGVTAAGQTQITVDEALECCTTAIPKGYRKSTKVVVSDALLADLLAAKSGEGDYLLRSLDGGGQTSCGKPLFAEPAADAGGISTGEAHLVAGDWARGSYFRTTPMLFKRSDEDPLNPVFHFAAWVDSAIADASALRALVTA